MGSRYARLPEDLSGIPLHTLSRSQDALVPPPLRRVADVRRIRDADRGDENDEDGHYDDEDDDRVGLTGPVTAAERDESYRWSWWRRHGRSRGEPAERKKKTEKKRKVFFWQQLTGWRLGTTTAALMTGVILIINIILLGMARSIRPGTMSDDGDDVQQSETIRTVRQGECGAIKELGIGLHLLINVVSTLLLGASNYCMQTISAPTRQDVDDAHAKGLFMDIGIPSIRNLGMIKTRRLIVWLCLGLSSIPLHLVYNSIIFTSTSNYMYHVYFADESFLQGAAFETEYPPDKSDTSSIYSPDSTSESTSDDDDDDDEPDLFWSVDAQEVQQDGIYSGRYEKLSNEDCIREYAKNLLQERGNVILIIDRPENCSSFRQDDIFHSDDVCVDSSTTSLYAALEYRVRFEAGFDQIPNWYYWICSQKSRYYANSLQPVPDLCSDGLWRNLLGGEGDAQEWEVYGQRVQYCMSERLPSQCRLQVAINLIGVVIAFNTVKLVIIVVMTASNLIHQNPLVTIGDATASFIERPDTRTEGMCLRSAMDILASDRTQIIPAVEYQPYRNRWAAAVTARRWWAVSLMIFFSLTAVLGLLGFAISALKAYGKDDFQSLWSLGIGVIAPHNLITGWYVPTDGEEAVVSTVLITNTPQVVFSLLYLILNGLVTSMLTAREWASHARHHKPLRVSFPEGGQRSTFFLQMPYRYSVPMMTLSILMHWLISQSFFIAQVEERLTDGSLSVTTTGAFSPVAMFLTSTVMVGAFAIILALARFRRLHEGMPLARNCSVAIAAACHGIPGTVSSQRPVMWGVVVPADRGREGVGRCAFSNDPVEPPQPGHLYA